MMSAISLTPHAALAQAAQLEPNQPPHLDSFSKNLRYSTSTFPVWYADRNGVVLELCSAKNDLSGFCLFDPPDGTPFSETLGFGAEAFWWLAEATMPFDGGQALLVMAVEAAFANENPIPGDEFNFGRVRMRIDASQPGTYKVTYPFGEETFEVETPGTKAINSTFDTGTFSPDASGPLSSKIGSFLVSTSAPPGYVGDGATATTVVGSPVIHPVRKVPQNFFRVERVGGASAETNQFTVSGKRYSGKIATRLEKRRVSYNSGRLEVLASSLPNATVTATYDGVKKTLTGDGRGYYFLSVQAAKPKTVKIEATSSSTELADITSDVVDLITISQADWNPTTKELTVAARSSMFQDGASTNPALVIQPFGVAIPNTGKAVVPNLSVPPSMVQVSSSEKGIETRTVMITDVGVEDPGTGTGGTGGAGGPVANPDPSPGTPAITAAMATPIVINVLGNDVNANGELLTPGSVTVQTVKAPDPLKAKIDAIDIAGIKVTPVTGFSGTFDFSYKLVAADGKASDPATVTVTVVPETLTATSIEFRTSKNEWRISGSSTARLTNTITASYATGSNCETAGRTIGSSTVDAAGGYSIRTTGTVPTSVQKVLIRSTKGASLCMSPTVRN